MGAINKHVNTSEIINLFIMIGKTHSVMQHKLKLHSGSSFNQWLVVSNFTRLYKGAKLITILRFKKL